MMIDNIIIGQLDVSEESLGILSTEKSIYLTINEAKFGGNQLWLPLILKNVGLFNSTSEIIKIDKQRLASSKFKDLKEQNICREIIEPESTRFKIGKKVFWLFVNMSTTPELNT